MKKGKLIVLSGPSGVGKGTVLKLFIDNPDLNLSYSISLTTRLPRVGEVDGINYHYVTKQRFEEAIAAGELLEYAEFVGNYYGTLTCEVDNLCAQGKNVLLEIEVQGALQVAKKRADAITIFIIPPSYEELERRIKARKSESNEIIQERLQKAYKEMDLIENYKYIVCNEDPQMAAEIISTIIKRSSDHN